jgi:hypothetical protein
VKHWLALRNTGAIRAAGIRGDARLYLFSGGLSFESDARPHIALSGSFFLAF